MAQDVDSMDGDGVAADEAKALCAMYATLRQRVGEEELEDGPEAVEGLDVMQVLQTVKAWMQVQADELTLVMEHAVRQAHVDLLLAVDRGDRGGNRRSQGTGLVQFRRKPPYRMRKNRTDQN